MTLASSSGGLGQFPLRRSEVGACAAHDVAAFVFAGGLQVEDAFFDHEGAGGVPEVEGEDLAFAGEEVVLDAETLHSFEMTAQDGGGDEVGDLGRIVVASSRAWRVSRRICLRAANLIGIGGVPLGDARVEVPAVEVDALVGLEGVR